jgi:glycine oxidase
MTSANRAPDVLIIGGGVIGLSAAWRAAQRGCAVEVLERGEPGAATSAVAAGMIAPIAEADPREQPLLELALASARAYPEFVAALRELTGMDPGYLRCGTLMVARDPDAAAALEREREIRRQLGLEVVPLTPSRARELEPALAPVLRGALELAGDCAVDPRRLTRALAEALLREGGALTRAEVAEVLLRNDRVVGVRLSDGALRTAGAVLIAAGPWSASIPGLPAPARVPIRPVKGQLLRLRDPGGPGLLTRVLRMQPGYLVPRGDGRYVLGASVEERGFDTTVTAGAIHRLLDDAIELVPGLAELVIDELVAGIRPGTIDNRPAIGPGAIEGLFWDTGHYRHGILLAPISAQLAVEALCGQAPSVLAEQVSPLRFAGRSLGATHGAVGAAPVGTARP